MCNTLNPATLLPIPANPEVVCHDCIQVMDEVFSSQPNLRDVPLKDPDITYFTDSSSFVRDGMQHAGYAIVTLTKTIEAQALPPGTSAQKAELIALIRALQLAGGQSVNIYTDSKYSFLSLHAHGALYKEKRLLSSMGN